MARLSFLHLAPYLLIHPLIRLPFHLQSGKVFSVEELQFIADLCIKHDVIALCDEVRMCQARLHNRVCINPSA